jgi:hypothetical protein
MGFYENKQISIPGELPQSSKTRECYRYIALQEDDFFSFKRGKYMSYVILVEYQVACRVNYVFSLPV